MCYLQTFEHCLLDEAAVRSRTDVCSVGHAASSVRGASASITVVRGARSGAP